MFEPTLQPFDNQVMIMSGYSFAVIIKLATVTIFGVFA